MEWELIFIAVLSGISVFIGIVFISHLWRIKIGIYQRQMIEEKHNIENHSLD